MKTADETLADLGYTVKGEVMIGMRYDTKPSGRTIIFDTRASEIRKAVYPHGFGQQLTFEEALACAKWIEEERQ